MEEEIIFKIKENNPQDFSDDEEEAEFQRLNLPKKSQYRMRAHCNPLAEISISYPITPKSVDWSLHYPMLFNKSAKENAEIFNNSNLCITQQTNIPSTIISTAVLNRLRLFL